VRTALVVAAVCERVGVLRALVELGADVNACGHGQTALTAAARLWRDAAVAMLLDMSAAEEHGYSAWHCAIQTKRDAAARLPIARRADVNARNEFQSTAMGWAADASNGGAVRSGR